MQQVHQRRWRLAAALASALAVGGALAGCTSGASPGSSAASGGPASPSAAATPASSSSSGSGAVATSACGTTPGVPASGTPIDLGAIATDQPGTSFTDIPNMAAAYFACVNDNGGISGHPISYHVLTEQTSPSQIASEARQLVTSDHVLGIVGNTSIIECTIDHGYWEKLGFSVIDSGIASECYSTPNSAAVTMGPRYSSDGAVQYAISQQVSKIVFDQSNVPGTSYIAAGPNALAAAAHIPISDNTTNVPISGASSVAINLVKKAGPNGAVVLNFTPPDALVILQAAQKLHIETHVREWGCSTQCNADYLAKSLGPSWDGRLFVNAELTPPDGTSAPAMNLYKAILAQYGSKVSGGIGPFSEMGFTEAELMVKALESVAGSYTVASVNAAIKRLKNVNTGMLCQAWSYGSYPLHIPNNEDYTVTPTGNGLMEAAPGSGCLAISTADPNIAQYVGAAGRAPTDPTSPGT